MPKLLFVHGTGVRKGPYLATFALVQRALARYGLDRYELEPCLWGDALGSRTPQRSVPGPEPKQRRTASAVDSAQERVRWELLYHDQWFELLLLLHAARKPSGPSRDAPHLGRALYERVSECRPSTETLQLLEQLGQDEAWRKAYRTVVESDLTREVFEIARDAVGETAQAAARAVVALMIATADLDAPVLDARSRDMLVTLMVRDWDAEVAGIAVTLTKFFLRTAATAGRPIMARRRREATDATSPAAGDILVYQARGHAIRAYIEQRIAECGDDVAVLAHSLGGIACVDLLARPAAPVRVKHLITCGSQASYLHELGALWGLEPGASELPSPFPAWLNIYDDDDLLSFMASPVFGASSVCDFKVASGQPFPYSHGAYWTNSATWKRVKEFLK